MKSQPGRKFAQIDANLKNQFGINSFALRAHGSSCCFLAVDFQSAKIRADLRPKSLWGF
jgi:hypothetical protein